MVLAEEVPSGNTEIAAAADKFENRKPVHPINSNSLVRFVVSSVNWFRFKSTSSNQGESPKTKELNMNFIREPQLE